MLTAQDLIPLLQWLSTPWSFWDGAQPSVELLLRTRDSRIAPRAEAFSSYAQWWQFVLAIQIFYSFLPRGLLLIGTRLIMLRRISLKEQNARLNLTEETLQHHEQEMLAPLVTEIESTCVLINWGGIPDAILDELALQYPRQIIDRLYAGPTAEESQQLIAQQSEARQLVLVKAWEPPLAELSDYLQTGDGYIMPLDWKKSRRVSIEPFHLEEWRRFAAAQKKWELLVWPETAK